MADDWNDDDLDTDVDSSEPLVCYDCGGRICNDCGVCHYCEDGEDD